MSKTLKDKVERIRITTAKTINQKIKYPFKVRRHDAHELEKILHHVGNDLGETSRLYNQISDITQKLIIELSEPDGRVDLYKIQNLCDTIKTNM